MPIIEGARSNVYIETIGGAASAAAVMSAVFDNGAQQVITVGLRNPPFPSRITATVAATTAAHVKNVQVTIGGNDPAGNAITEALPAFTDNTPGVVTGAKVFATVNSVTIPAMDGATANVTVGVGGAPKVADTNDILAAVTDTGVQQVITTGIVQPDVARNITATAGGTAGDIKAIAVIIAGTNIQGQAITETLPVFTVDTPGTVAGAKAFKTVTSITIPAHDGVGATTAIGFGDIIGLSRARAIKSVRAAFLDGVLEGTAPTEVADGDEVEKNTVDLNSALNSVPVQVEYVSQG